MLVEAGLNSNKSALKSPIITLAASVVTTARSSIDIRLLHPLHEA